MGQTDIQDEANNIGPTDLHVVPCDVVEEEHNALDDYDIEGLEMDIKNHVTRRIEQWKDMNEAKSDLKDAQGRIKTALKEMAVLDKMLADKMDKLTELRNKEVAKPSPEGAEIIPEGETSVPVTA